MSSIAPTSQADILDQIFNALKDKSHEVRVQAALELQRYVGIIVHAEWTISLIPDMQVIEVVPEMSSDVAVKIWDDTINRKLSDLVHSQTNGEKLGGITAIGM